MAVNEKCNQGMLEQARAIAASHRGQPGALLPTLHAVQAKVRWLSPAVLEVVAAELGLPLSKVYGTATFYTLFNTEPKGKHIIRVCESAPCHVNDAEQIIDELTTLLGIQPGQTTADGVFTLERAACLGVCGVAPAMMVNDNVHGNLKPGDLARILSDYRRQAEKEA